MKLTVRNTKRQLTTTPKWIKEKVSDNIEKIEWHWSNGIKVYSVHTPKGIITITN